MPKRDKPQKPDPKPPVPPRPTDDASEMEHQVSVLRRWCDDAPAFLAPAVKEGGAWRLTQEQRDTVDAKFAGMAAGVAKGAEIPLSAAVRNALIFVGYKVPAGSGTSRMGGEDIQRPPKRSA